MTHVDLNTVNETVRKAILSFSAHGTIFELDGRPVASLIPPRNDREELDSWSSAKNARRFYLIDRSIASTITADEAIELDELQSQMGRWLDRVAPLPIEAARKLHGELIELANRNSITESK